VGDAAVTPWGSSPIYRPPDARPEWEEPVRRPRRSLAVFRSGVLRIDAIRAEDALEDVTLAQAHRTLALRRRLNRATAQATRAVEQRRRQDAVRTERVTAAERARLEQARLEAERVERERLITLERARLEAERVESERLAALELARLEQEQREETSARKRREEARRSEGRDRLTLANKLERSAELLRDYEEWARSRGLPCAGDAGLSVEADRLGREVEQLRYG
jgi:hypothetical protein